MLFEETEYFQEAFEIGEKVFSLGDNIQIQNFRWELDWTDPTIFKNAKSFQLEDYKPPIAPVIELVSYYSFREKIYYNTKLFNEKYYVMPIKTNAHMGKITYQPRFFISSLSDEVEASLNFLHFLNYDKELYTLFRFGIEGIDYVNTPSGM